MPYRVRLDPEAGLVEIVFEGVLGQDDVADAVRKLLFDPVYAHQPLGLFDASGVTSADFATDLIWQTARSAETAVDPHLARGKLAIVAPGDEAFGLSRIYQSLRERSPVEVRVFRARADAERWLGL